MKITDSSYFYQGLQSGPKSWSNSILVCGKKIILIDPGSNIDSHLEDLILAIAEDEKYNIESGKTESLDISKVNEIWLTHGHPDHVGLAAVLLKQYKIEAIRCHFKSEGILEDLNPLQAFMISFRHSDLIKRKKIAKSPFFWRNIFLKILICLPWLGSKILKIVTIIMEKFAWGKWLPVPEVKVFTKEELIENNPDIQVLFLPGHSPDEIGFWIEKEKALIIGDIINISRNREVIPALVSPQSNFDEAIASLKRIKELPVEILIPAHGFFLRGNEIITRIITKMIARMERHSRMVKDILEKNPKTNIDQLARMVMNDLPLFISHGEKKQYLVSILVSLGYYDNGNGKNGKKGNGSNNHKNNNKSSN